MIFLVLLFPLFTGFLLISLLCPGGGRAEEPWKVAAGFGAGMGIFSLCFFFWAILSGSPGPSFLWLQTGVLLALAAAAYSQSRRSAGGPPVPALPISPGPLWLRRCLRIFCVIAALAAAANFAFLALEKTHGDWDAWALWNMRARFLFRGGRFWTDAFSPITFHPDYPLLLPASVSGFWLLLGKDSTSAPIALAFAFLLATVGLLAFALRRLRGEIPALMGVLVLLACPFFLIHSTSQYADLPLALFFLGTTVLLTFAFFRPEGRNRYLTAAGLFAGFAAWTKNEGQLFFLCIVLGYLAWMPSRGPRETLRDLAHFLLGALPLLAVLVFFKLNFAPPNDLMSSFGAATWEKLSDGSRYRKTAEVFFAVIRDFGQWKYHFPLLLGFYFLLMGPISHPARRQALPFFLTVAALTLTGFFFIYITTPLELMWHLGTSLTRIYFQLWPSFVFLFFLFARAPWEPEAVSSS